MDIVTELNAELPADFGEVPHVELPEKLKGIFRPITERDMQGFTDADIAELNAAEDESK